MSNDQTQSDSSFTKDENNGDDFTDTGTGGGGNDVPSFAGWGAVSDSDVGDLAEQFRAVTLGLGSLPNRIPDRMVHTEPCECIPEFGEHELDPLEGVDL